MTTFSPTHRWTPEEVTSPQTFAEYCQQQLGTPWPSVKGMVQLHQVLKAFFAHNPRASYATLCRVVQWCKSNRRRPSHAATVTEYTRYAFTAGVLPELSPADDIDDELEAAIARALEVEKDPEWRLRLAGSLGSGRREVFDAWQRQRASSPSR